MRAFTISIVLAGCGRVAFDPLADGGASPIDESAIPRCARFAAADYCNDFDTPDLGIAVAEFALGHSSSAGQPDSPGAWVMTGTMTNFPRITVPLATPVFAGPLHVGGWLFVEGTVQVPEYVVLAQLQSPSSSKISFDLVADDRAQVVNIVASGVEIAGNNTVPRDRWFCYELAVEVADAGGGGEVRLAIDGTELIRAWVDQPTLPADGWSLAEVLVVQSPANPAPLTLHVDNLIVARTPIGCPRLAP